MTPLHIDVRAEEDLFEITRYLLGFGADAADRFVAAFWDVVEDLRQFPELGQRSREHPEIRVMRRGIYLFLYEAREEDVLLLRILDGRAQPELP